MSVQDLPANDSERSLALRGCVPLYLEEVSVIAKLLLVSLGCTPYHQYPNLGTNSARTRSFKAVEAQIILI